jgi:hypothetical protein
MSDKRDVPELPGSPKRRNIVVAEPVEAEIVPRGDGALTSAQTDSLIQGGVEVAKEALEIGKKIMHIWEIREQADADVARIDAHTRQIVEVLRGHVAHVEARRGAIRERGDVTIRIIRELTPAIRDSALPEAAKLSLINTLPNLVREALAAPEHTPKVPLGSSGAKSKE